MLDQPARSTPRHGGSHESPDTPADRKFHDPLAGLLVVDFTIVMSGPLCTRALADAGANVIKIEPPHGDMVRHRPPFRSGHSTYFASMNCGKRGTVLDLQTEDGRRLATELALKADVVVENFRPGVMKRLGLGYEELSARNPRLIYCSISGFGQTGPMANAPAYAPVIHASSGYEHAYMQYQGAERPANNGIFIADVLGASNAVAAINLALYDRERTGRGQCIDVSLMDSVLAMLVHELQVAQFPQDRPRQVYQPVRASDGFVMVAAITPKNLETLFEVIGFPEGKTDPRFATVREKESNWGVLLDIIERWTERHTARECEQILMKAGVPCSRYRSVKEAIEDPQAVERGSLVRLGSEEEPFMVANTPYRFSDAQVGARTQLPGLGEHTEEVLAEVLGCDAESLRRMREAGVFGH